MDMIVKKYEGIQYIKKFPSDYEKGKKYPTILFLHGAGGRGEDIDLVKNNPYFKITGEYKNFPFITIAPQCPETTWNDVLWWLKKLTYKLLKEDYVDDKRLYVMGPSMGGYGTWQLAMSLPEAFAAIVPLCGGGLYWNAERLVNMPVWAFHGARDHLVSVMESVNMVNKINDLGGNAKLTIYPDRKHDAWTPTYSNPEVFEWLLSNVNENKKVIDTINKFNDSKIYG